MKRRTSPASTQPRLRGLVAAVLTAALCGVATAQTTIGIGQSLVVSQNTGFESNSPLILDGGILNIRNPFAPVTVGATDAILRNGAILSGNDQFPATINFFGTTKIGNPTSTGSFPANAMYFIAPTESSWTVTNRGDFELKSGLLVLSGSTFLRSASPSSGPARLLLENDSSILGDPGKTGIPGTPYTIFSPSVGLPRAGGFQNPFGGGLILDGTSANPGGLGKISGTGTSEIRVPVTSNSSNIVVFNGTLALTNSGNHNNSGFYADPLSINPDSRIIFGTNPFGADNMYAFTGTNTTDTGRFLLEPGVVLRVTGEASVWRQQANFQALGTIDLDGARLVNSGTLAADKITGRSYTGPGFRIANLENTTTGTFSGNIRAGVNLNTYSVDLLQTVQISNRGRFEIAGNQTVEANNFVNHDGTLVVNGQLSNYGGKLELLGGVLSGNGIINSDTFVGGGPGVAKFRPGSSPGTMTINGDFSLLPGGVLELEVESTPGGIAFDQLVISGSILLNGRVSFLVGAGVTASDVAGLNFFSCAGTCQIEYGTDFSADFPNRPGSTWSTDSQRITNLAAPFDPSAPSGPPLFPPPPWAPTAPVPEPAPFVMMLAGLGLAGWMSRRRLRTTRD